MLRPLSRLLLFVSLAGFASAGTSSPATPPPTVALCDLITNPQVFDGRWIQVRGHVSVGFENFSLYEPGCDKALTRGIWLMYGGDEETPTIYCCGDHSRHKGQDVQVRGQSISLIRDAAMQDFIAKVASRRKRLVNGAPCRGSTCNLYDVAGTVTGMFFAGPVLRAQGGYGHLGCCHLLVIHRVSEVKAERTAVPDEEGVFTCSKQSWTAEFAWAENEMLDRHAANQKFLAQQMRQHGDAALVEVMRNTLSPRAGLDGELFWIAPDLLTSYTIPLAESSRKNRNRPLTAARRVPVTRERCVAAANQP